ncbi:BapA prefix-like domain-containing protein [Novosphingobium panipatense]
MAVEIFDKATRATRTVSEDSVVIDGASVIKVYANRADLSALERQGNDLLIRLRSGEEIRVVNFYGDSTAGNVSEVVLQDTDGELWAVRQGDTRVHQHRGTGRAGRTRCFHRCSR